MEPENAGNIGAVARAMANFGLSSLILIDPKIEHLSHESRCRAKHAQKILLNAAIIRKKELSSFDCVIGTTAKTGTDYNIPRSPLSAEELAKRFHKKWDSDLDICLLFGREGKGLTNAEVRKCDFIVKISTSPDYPTLNLSHACAILFYEIFKKRAPATKIEHMKAAEKEILLKKVYAVLDTMEFSTADKKETQKKVWKRVIGKSMLTKREGFALIGFFKKIFS